MMKLKKGFAVAMAAGVLTTGGLGVQATVFSATAFAQLGGGSGAEGTSADADSTPTLDAYNTAVNDLTSAKESATIPDKATLYIHKLADTGQAKNAGTGVRDDSVTGTPVEAKFKVIKITKNGGAALDMSTNADQEKIAKLAAGFKAGNFKNETEARAYFTGKGYDANDVSGVLDTKGDGLAEKELDKGVYLVVETEAKKGGEIGQEVSYDVSVKPFVVALPITNPATHTGWLNQLHVYPKNQKSSKATKVATSAGSFIGSEVVDGGNLLEYQISQELTPGKPFDGVQIADHYDGSQLTVKKDATVVKLGDDVLTKDTDYELVEKDAGDARTLTVKLRAPGLTKVNDGNKVNESRKITVDLVFEGRPVTEKAKSKIENKFKTWTHRGDEPTPTTPSEPNNPGDDPSDPNKPPTGGGEDDPNFPKTFYGQVNIKKLKLKDGSATETEDLPDAKFDLYTCHVDTTTTPQTPQLVLDDKLNKTAIATKSDDPEVTPEISGLLANDYDINGTYRGAPADKFYCLKEVEAPAGFELLAEPIKFQVLAGDNATEVEVTATDAVIDSKGNGGFELPLTGGKGVFALLLAGAAFLVLGRGYSVYAGRRKDA